MTKERTWLKEFKEIGQDEYDRAKAGLPLRFWKFTEFVSKVEDSAIERVLEEVEKKLTIQHADNCETCMNIRERLKEVRANLLGV